ncbi:VanZ family protein [Sutcliffiella deserti]|uniref:VanZ family protein n=1 Tax=Sutcliffiella deserti TaxID=2875501 RepID=UPI001CBB6631|nr:VanZ family protein [Sutcliffiella deserti]
MFFKRRKYYYLLLASGWTILVFHLSSMSYVEQDLKPYLRLFVEEDVIISWFHSMHLSYSGNVVSVESLGGYSFLEFVLRKGAHLFFYFMLGFVLVRYFRTFLVGKAGKSILLGFCMVLLIAMLDEFLQHLNPNRSGMWLDVWLDCTGGFLGVILGSLSDQTFGTQKRVDHSM